MLSIAQNYSTVNYDGFFLKNFLLLWTILIHSDMPIIYQGSELISSKKFPSSVIHCYGMNSILILSKLRGRLGLNLASKDTCLINILTLDVENFIVTAARIHHLLLFNRPAICFHPGTIIAHS